MALTGLHLLLTYRCTSACEHCFVWASPRAGGDMTLDHARALLLAAKRLGTVKTVYAEGGEPFLLYPIMLRTLQEAAALGFDTGIVTNAYWAVTVADAMVWLEPLAALGLKTLSVSTDCYHASAIVPERVRHAREAAQALGISSGVLKGAERPEQPTGVMYRGRAAALLAARVPKHPWTTFDCCPYETLDRPGRVHVDEWGHVHLCQGLTLGRATSELPFDALVRAYDPERHPVVAPLLRGGPAELVRAFDLPLRGEYADACHLCYLARLALRECFPSWLGPGQVYGEQGAD